MLNLKLGSFREIDGRPCIVTASGRKGHAVYGPYISLPPGEYVVEFVLSLGENEQHSRDFRCAVLDVVRQAGSDVLVTKPILLSQLSDGRNLFALSFGLQEESRLEFRVAVNGKTSLVIEDAPRVVGLDPGQEPLARLAATSFPEEQGASIPFYVENRATLRSLYDQGVGVGIHREQVVLTAGGVSLFARVPDDLTFIGEVFFENAYNFKVGSETIVIDIGMNIGLATLMFAVKPEVHEVHSFEPFANTYDRAIGNIGLNAEVSGKIHAYNYGLSDRDVEDTIIVPSTGDSGSASIVSVQSGRPVHVVLKDAGAFLGPIIAQARAAGRQVVVKVDCEGSEFAIFESLERHGLLTEIAAFMVEWHAMFDDKTQETLIAPLRANGFLVFDRSPPVGNGFFYAARLAV